MEKAKLIKKLERASLAVAAPGYQSVFAIGESQATKNGQRIDVSLDSVAMPFVSTVQLLLEDTQTLHLISAPRMMNFALALYISAFELGRSFEQIDSLERLAEMEDDRG